MSRTAGTFTIGTSGDFASTTEATLHYAGETVLSGNLTLVVLPETEVYATGIIIETLDFSGYNLTITSDHSAYANGRYGTWDMIGYSGAIWGADSAFVGVYVCPIGSGSLNIENLNIYIPPIRYEDCYGEGMDIDDSSCSGTFPVIIKNNFIYQDNTAYGIGIYCDSFNAIMSYSVYNNIVVGGNDPSLVLPTCCSYYIESGSAMAADSVFENNVAVGVSGYNNVGFTFGVPGVADRNDLAEYTVFKNNVAIDNNSGDFLNVVACSGYTNCSSDDTAGDSEWLTGTGNLSGIASSDAFVSTDVNSLRYLYPKPRGILYKTGTVNTESISRTHDIKGRQVPTPPSIGAIEPIFPRRRKRR